MKFRSSLDVKACLGERKKELKKPKEKEIRNIHTYMMRSSKPILIAPKLGNLIE